MGVRWGALNNPHDQRSLSRQSSQYVTQWSPRKLGRWWALLRCVESIIPVMLSCETVWNVRNISLTMMLADSHCLLSPAITLRLKPVPTCRAAALYLVRSCPPLSPPSPPRASIGWSLPAWRATSRRQAGPLTPATLSEPQGQCEGRWAKYFNLFGHFQQVSVSRIIWPWPWDRDINIMYKLTDRQKIFLRYFWDAPPPQTMIQAGWWGGGRQDAIITVRVYLCASNTGKLVPPSPAHKQVLGNRIIFHRKMRKLTSDWHKLRLLLTWI